MKNFLLIFGVVFVVSCKIEPKPAPVPVITPKDVKLEEIVIDNTGIVIKYGFIEGWCSGTDSMIIAGNDVWYVDGAVCGKNVSAKYLDISPIGKELLLQLFDQTAFDKLELNSCFVCVDGTDCWISVQNGSYFHKIRYAYGDSVHIATIRPFVRELDMYRAIFR